MQGENFNKTNIFSGLQKNTFRTDRNSDGLFTKASGFETG